MKLYDSILLFIFMELDMKKLISEIIALFLVLIASLGVILGTILFKNNSNPEIELLARAPERGNWYPKKIKVEKDKEVNILIRNVDTVSHGFYLPAFDITAGEIKAAYSDESGH
ncbi:MAG: hypothetical protein AB1410_01955 [Acidobacteriota bacterium]